MCAQAKSDDGDAHDAALPFHKLAGEPSLFSLSFFFLFFFRSIVSSYVCIICVPVLSLTFIPFATLLLFLVSCRSFYYGGTRASAISYRRDDAHISSVAASRGALAAAAQLGSTLRLHGLPPEPPTSNIYTLLDPTLFHFFFLSYFSQFIRPCPAKTSLILLFSSSSFRCSHSVSFFSHETIKLINPDVVSLSVLNTHLPHAVVVPSCIYPIELRPAYYSFFFFFFFSPFFWIRYPQSMLLERCKPPR
jgi:hypothetical protein